MRKNFALVAAAVCLLATGCLSLPGCGAKTGSVSQEPEREKPSSSRICWEAPLAGQQDRQSDSARSDVEKPKPNQDSGVRTGDAHDNTAGREPALSAARVDPPVKSAGPSARRSARNTSPNAPRDESMQVASNTDAGSAGQEADKAAGKQTESALGAIKPALSTVEPERRDLAFRVPERQPLVSSGGQPDRSAAANAEASKSKAPKPDVPPIHGNTERTKQPGPTVRSDLPDIVGASSSGTLTSADLAGAALAPAQWRPESAEVLGDAAKPARDVTARSGTTSSGPASAGKLAVGMHLPSSTAFPPTGPGAETSIGVVHPSAGSGRPELRSSLQAAFESPSSPSGHSLPLAVETFDSPSSRPAPMLAPGSAPAGHSPPVDLGLPAPTSNDRASASGPGPAAKPEARSAGVPSTAPSAAAAPQLSPPGFATISAAQPEPEASARPPAEPAALRAARAPRPSVAKAGPVRKETAPPSPSPAEDQASGAVLFAKAKPDSEPASVPSEPPGLAMALSDDPPAKEHVLSPASAGAANGDYQVITVFYGTDRQALQSAGSRTWNFIDWAYLTAIVGGVSLLLGAVAYCHPRNRLLLSLALTAAVGTAALGVSTFHARQDTPAAGDGSRTYGNDRGTLEMGTCQVTIPKGHATGEIERPSIFRLQFREDPERHIVLSRVEAQPEEEFFDRLKARIDASQKKEALVFVHGFNVTFEAAARRTAQLAYDLKIDGAPVFFSWPSQGGLLRYAIDETNVTWSAPHLKEFLVGVARRSGATSVNLIAHSMGNRALASALQILSYELKKEPPLFAQVVLTAPDIDADVFKRDIAPRIVKTAGRVTLYASSNDEALKISKGIHGYPRAGDSGPDLVVVPGIDTIDVTQVDTSLIGHSYYSSNNTVLKDLFDLLSESKPPDQRSSLQPLSLGEMSYWVFTPGPAGLGASRQAPEVFRE